MQESTAAEQWLEQATARHRSGELGAAEQLYRQVLEADPENARAAFLLGALRHEAGAHQEALELMKRAVVVSPDNASYQAALGEAYRQIDERQTALRLFERAVHLEPRNADYQLLLARELCDQQQPARAIGHLQCAVLLARDASEARQLLQQVLVSRPPWANTGSSKPAPPVGRAAAPKRSPTVERAYVLAQLHHRAGRIGQAEAQYRRLLKVEPKHAEALFWFGSMALETGRAAFAAELLGRACGLDPLRPSYWSNWGEALSRTGESERSVAAFRRSLDLEPDSAERHFNLAVALRSAESEHALEHFERAAQLAPAQSRFQLELARQVVASDERRAVGHFQAALASAPSADALLELAEVLRRLGSREATLASCQQATLLEPTSARAHHQLGKALADSRRTQEAIASQEQALRLDPKLPGARGELALALFGDGDVTAAVAHWEQALACDPSDVIADSNRVFALAFHPGYGDADIAQAARKWAERHELPLRARLAPHPNELLPDKRLRVGYVSSVFREHALGIFIAPLVLHRRRDDFELYCYSGVTQPDAVTERLRRSADVWRDTAKLSDLELAELIRADGIDVLVDLNMHMATSRLRTFACRPAPVQLSWAYPGTTGLSQIDYRLTDRHIDPPELELPYVESSIVLPDTYWCYDSLLEEPPAVGPLPAQSGRPFQFGNLNGTWKINTDIVASWSRVLRAVPESTLALLGPGLAAGKSRRADPSEARLLALFERHGVAPARIRFLPRTKRLAYLEYYRDIDLCLDSLPYAGHTTSLDALWMGVPVLSQRGATVVGRAGVCFAKNLDLPELVVSTEDELVERALVLSRDLEGLARLRGSLRERLQRSALMDGPRFARNVEAACRSAWQHHCAGHKPRRIDLPVS